MILWTVRAGLQNVQNRTVIYLTEGYFKRSTSWHSDKIVWCACFGGFLCEVAKL